MSDQAVHIVQGSSELSVPTHHPPAHTAAHLQLPLNRGLRCINTVEQNAANVFANDEKRQKLGNLSKITAAAVSKAGISTQVYLPDPV